MANVHLEGRAMEDARARRTRSGWRLEVDVEIPPMPGYPPATFAVRRQYGLTEADGLACRSKARQMCKGTLVRVAASAGRGRVVLAHVHDIDLPDFNANSLHQRISP